MDETEDNIAILKRYFYLISFSFVFHVGIFVQRIYTQIETYWKEARTAAIIICSFLEDPSSLERPVYMSLLPLAL
jgi:hypothetical protein